MSSHLQDVEEVPPLLRVEGLHKAYVTPVLRAVDFVLGAGEVHALVGENGAGKSTFSRILAGLAQPDAGTITFRGRPFAPASRREAQACGVRMVLQELNLIGTLTVAESLFLDRLPHRWGFLDRDRLRQEAGPLLAQVGLDDVHPDTPIHELGVGRRQLVEIAAGLSQRCDLLILDEPTAALTDAEISRLFTQIARLKAQGTSVLYISHRMEEIRMISDRVSVLRDGQCVATRAAAAMDLEEIIQLMVGRRLEERFHRRGAVRDELALRVEGLSRRPAVENVSLVLRRGEILGLAGLMGSGRTELLRAIVGADAPDAGRVYLGEAPQPICFRSPRDAVRKGVALLTEDRKEQGLLLPLPIRTNVSLPSLARLSRHGWVDRRAESACVEKEVGRLALRCVSIEQPAVELSGGNQQKVVLAKWLLADCQILLCDEPTRGIDVGARFEIYQMLDRLAADGKAVLVVSSDLRELMDLCDRIAVLSAGSLVETFSRGEWSQEKIMAAALSRHLGQALP